MERPEITDHGRRKGRPEPAVGQSTIDEATAAEIDEEHEAADAREAEQAEQADELPGVVDVEDAVVVGGGARKGEHVEASTELATQPAATLVSPTGQFEWNREQVELVKRTVAKGSSDAELQLFMHVVQRTGLDPFAKQIYFIKRWDSEARAEVFQPQVAIDGLRLIAERTGEYEGRSGPEWCGPDGAWSDVWLAEEPPHAARVLVHRAGRQPTAGVALYREYVQTKRDGTPRSTWKVMPTHMLGKVAESLALRAAFPQELGDVYSFEELPAPEGQGDDAGDDVQAEAAELVTDEQLTNLRECLAILIEQPGWTSEEQVVAAARKSFSRPIGTLADLTAEEADKILGVARPAAEALVAA